ncbi:MAG TPA: putative quinol monooxygenase [Ktedonobacteraceae bacterium]|nr:putative quinol monooxygenase [Ktedonobacteraceae bacterium]
MICVSVTYIVQPGHEAEALDIFNTMQQHTRTEPGNVLYIAHRSISDPRHFFLYEQYTDQDAFQAHRTADYFVQNITNRLMQMIESRVAEIGEPL